MRRLLTLRWEQRQRGLFMTDPSDEIIGYCENLPLHYNAVLSVFSSYLFIQKFPSGYGRCHDTYDRRRGRTYFTAWRGCDTSDIYRLHRCVSGISCGMVCNRNDFNGTIYFTDQKANADAGRIILHKIYKNMTEILPGFHIMRHILLGS